MPPPTDNAKLPAAPPAFNPPAHSRSAPVPVAPEPKTNEKVTDLGNGKQLMEVSSTIVNPDGSRKTERKKKVKSSDKKKKKKQDEGVDHHCQCVVM
jgi:hypothetical protein